MDVVFGKCVIHAQLKSSSNANYFSWEHEKNNRVKKAKLVVFNLSKITNYVNMKMRTKTKYQTSRRQNSN